jgi:hypothetical protein
VSERNHRGLVLDKEARRFLGSVGLLVVGIEIVVLVAIWLVQQYFS